MRYKRKSEVVDAIEFTGDNWQMCLQFVSNEMLMFPQEMCSKDYISIETPAGALRVEAGDYIVRDTSGECYPCKPDIFHEMYDEIGIYKTNRDRLNEMSNEKLANYLIDLRCEACTKTRKDCDRAECVSDIMLRLGYELGERF